MFSGVSLWTFVLILIVILTVEGGLKKRLGYFSYDRFSMYTWEMFRVKKIAFRLRLEYCELHADFVYVKYLYLMLLLSSSFPFIISVI